MLSVPPPQPRASGHLTWAVPSCTRSRPPGAGPWGCGGRFRSTCASWTSVSTGPSCTQLAHPSPLPTAGCPCTQLAPPLPAASPCGWHPDRPSARRLASCLLLGSYHGSHPCRGHGQGHHCSLFRCPSGPPPQPHKPTCEQDHRPPHHTPAPHHGPQPCARTPAPAPRRPAAPEAL